MLLRGATGSCSLELASSTGHLEYSRLLDIDPGLIASYIANRRRRFPLPNRRNRRFLQVREIKNSPPYAYSPLTKTQILGIARKVSTMAVSNTQSSKADDANRNIMLYWDKADPFPSDIVKVSELWMKFSPEWDVTLFSKETAGSFLREKFGVDVVRLFLTCAVPAMRADFFRVFWAISEGGIYSDLTFAPIREPLFFDPEKNLTVVKRPDGAVIRNNIFYSKKDCKEMKLIAYEIMKSVSKRESTHIAFATGPRIWTKILTSNKKDSVTILEWEDLFGDYIKFSRYPSSTYGTHMHWKELQLRMNIYQDPPEIPD